MKNEELPPWRREGRRPNAEERALLSRAIDDWLALMRFALNDEEMNLRDAELYDIRRALDFDARSVVFWRSVARTVRSNIRDRQEDRDLTPEEGRIVDIADRMFAASERMNGRRR